MRLTKYCKSMHVPAPGRSLKLGPLSSFKVTDNLATKDSGEGDFTITLNLDPNVVLTTRWLNEITFGMTLCTKFGLGSDSVVQNSGTLVPFSQGPSNGVCWVGEDYRVHQRNSDKITLSGQIKIHLIQNDSWLFCMSKSDAEKSVIKDESYGACWSVKGASVFSFASHLFRELSQKILELRGGIWEPVGMDPFPNLHYFPEIYDEKGMANPAISTIGLKKSMGEVSYFDREVLVESEAEWPFSRILGILAHAPFIKPTRYSHEQEFRFRFQPAIVYKDGSLSFSRLKLRSVYLPCEAMLEHIDLS